MASNNPEQHFQQVVDALVGWPGVTPPWEQTRSKKFGSSPELRVDNRIFAMLTKGRLVVKLPRGRVDELVAAGEGERFDPGHGRLMKEWLSLDAASGQDWVALATEALGFVGSKR